MEGTTRCCHDQVLSSCHTLDVSRGKQHRVECGPRSAMTAIAGYGWVCAQRSTACARARRSLRRPCPLYGFTLPARGRDPPIDTLRGTSEDPPCGQCGDVACARSASQSLDLRVASLLAGSPAQELSRSDCRHGPGLPGLLRRHRPLLIASMSASFLVVASALVECSLSAPQASSGGCVMHWVGR